MMRTSKVHFFKLLLASLGLCTSLSTEAFDYLSKGDVLVVSGTIANGEADRMKEFLAAGIHIVIFYKITNTGIAADAIPVHKVLRDADVTTVAHGRCNPACARLFLGGARRTFSALGPTESHWIASGVMMGKNKSYNADDSYLQRHIVDVPQSVWSAYVTPDSPDKTDRPELRVYHPGAKLSANGTVLGCTVKTSGTDLSACQSFPELSALSTKYITTEERFDSPFLRELDAKPTSTATPP